MTELDEAWDLALAEAKERARAAGRRDIANYLDLRRQNDLLRRTATDWLIETVTLIAGKANRTGAAIQIEQDEEHRFPRGTATMVGKRVTLRQGVRALTIESGWPRTPRDGIVRGGGLACANIRHFGRPRANVELLLMRSSSGSPQWFAHDKHGKKSTLGEEEIKTHISLLLKH
ncbi:MAG TPA: hypothetical protein VIU65_04315 [Pyrinomonadaceae bacterium]